MHCKFKCTKNFDTMKFQTHWIYKYTENDTLMKMHNSTEMKMHNNTKDKMP